MKRRTIRILDQISFAVFMASIVSMIGFGLFGDELGLKISFLIFVASIALGFWTNIWFKTNDKP